MLSVIPKPLYSESRNGYYMLREGIEEDMLLTLRDDLAGDEYELTVSDCGISVKAGGKQGAFYALQTLRQLEANTAVPNCFIKDKPRYPYRGFMIDSARHMQSVSEIKKYIEAAALFKLNRFHWHITDDQGWRMESKTFPRLTDIGAYRRSSDFGNLHTGKPYGGYYTKQQMKEIVDFCAERFIEVIPEIDMPGHCSAAIAAYPHLGCTGKQIDVETSQGIYKNILCAGKDSTLEFAYGVLQELMEVFPGSYVHIGGDEAPKVRWDTCPHCKKRIADEGLSNSEQLQGWFTNKLVAYLRDHGKTAIAWNESLKSGMLDCGTVVQNWMDKDKLCPGWVNSGGKMIASDFYHYYLDYPYGMTPLKKTLSFNPIVEGISCESSGNVIGVEAPIWTEYVRDFQRMCYMCFPRLAAVAQTGWSPAGTDSSDFEKSMTRLLPLLRSMGISCAEPSEWNPLPHKRAKQVASFFSATVNREVVRNLLGGKKE